MQFIDRIETSTLIKLEGLKIAVTELKAPYDILTGKLEKAKRAMPGSCVYRGEQFSGFGYDYDGLSASFQNIHRELIEQHREAFLVMTTKDREYLAAKDALFEEVGNAVALEYKAKAEELGELHSMLYGLIHSLRGGSSMQQFMNINVPSGTHYGNLENTTDKPFSRSAILYEQKAITEGNEMAKQVRAFMREY